MRRSIFFPILVAGASLSGSEAVAPAKHDPRGPRAAAAARSDSRLMSLPRLGYLVLPESGELRAIIGIPGASRVSDPLSLPAEVVRLHMAPGREFGLASTDRGWSIALLAGGELELGPRLAGLELPGEPQVQFNPAGSAAVLWSREAGRAWIVGGLPNRPEILWTTGLAEAERLALSRNADLLAAAADRSAWLYRAWEPGEVIYDGGPITALAFSSQADSLVIGDLGHSRVVVMEEAATRRGVRLLDAGGELSRPNAAVFSKDGGSVWVTDATKPVVVRFEIAAAMAEAIPLARPAAGIEPLGFGDSFLLSPPAAGEPGWMVTTSEGMPRLLFLPGIPAEVPEEQGVRQ